MRILKDEDRYLTFAAPIRAPNVREGLRKAPNHPVIAFATAVAVTLAGLGCSAARPDPVALLKADRDFAQATAERRLEGFASFLEEDVTSIRPNSPVLKGKNALLERWSGILQDPTATISWKPLRAVIAASGDLGFTVGSYEVTRDSGQGKKAAGSGKYITIWRKQPDGTWKVTFDSGVQDALPAGKAP
jgi:ketosteroid isomerase-like protein